MYATVSALLLAFAVGLALGALVARGELGSAARFRLQRATRRQVLPRIERFAGSPPAAASPGVLSGAEKLRQTAEAKSPAPQTPRAGVVAEVARHPEWDAEQIYKAGLRAGLWVMDGNFDAHRDRNRKRATRLRQRAAALRAHHASRRQRSAS